MFIVPLPVASTLLNLTIGEFKDLCRGYGIKKWPYKPSKLEERQKKNKKGMFQDFQLDPRKKVVATKNEVLPSFSNFVETLKE